MLARLLNPCHCTRAMKKILRTEAGKIGVATVVGTTLLFLVAIILNSLPLALIAIPLGMCGGIYTIGLMTAEDDYWTLALLFVFPMTIQLVGAWLLVQVGGVPY